MKLLGLALGTVLVMSSLGSAIAKDNEVKYSTEEYCLLDKAGEQAGMLKAYAKKLGGAPSKSVCRSFSEFVKKAQPKDWDYRGGRPYPGSVLRLSASQIEKLKSSKD